MGTMTDYYPTLSRMVAGLETNTGQSRRALYGRARAMLCEHLRTVEPPLTADKITQERLALEMAIRKFEADALRGRREPPNNEPIPGVGNKNIDFAVAAEALAPSGNGSGAEHTGGQQHEQVIDLPVSPEGDGELDQFGSNLRPSVQASVESARMQLVSESPQTQQIKAAEDLLGKLVAAQGQTHASHAPR